jgi:hypothetical protein
MNTYCCTRKLCRAGIQKASAMEEQAMYKKTKNDDIWRQASILLNKSISADI